MHLILEEDPFPALVDLIPTVSHHLCLKHLKKESKVMVSSCWLMLHTNGPGRFNHRVTRGKPDTILFYLLGMCTLTRGVSPTRSKADEKLRTG